MSRFKSYFNEPVEEQRNQPEREETAEEHERRMKEVEELKQKNGRYIKKWNKALKQIYPVLIEAYKITGK